MTKRELMDLMEPLSDDAEVLVLEHEQFMPAKASLTFSAMHAVVKIEPMSFYEYRFENRGLV